MWATRKLCFTFIWIYCGFTRRRILCFGNREVLKCKVHSSQLLEVFCLQNIQRLAECLPSTWGKVHSETTQTSVLGDAEDVPPPTSSGKEGRMGLWLWPCPCHHPPLTSSRTLLACSSGATVRNCPLEHWEGKVFGNSLLRTLLVNRRGMPSPSKQCYVPGA